jgi:hypothetical protein
MSVDLAEPTTPPTQRLGKRKALRSELFIRDLFEERNLPQGHANAKTHREVRCLNCKIYSDKLKYYRVLTR